MHLFQFSTRLTFIFFLAFVLFSIVVVNPSIEVAEAQQQPADFPIGNTPQIEDNWPEVAQLIDDTSALVGNFGIAVDIDGDTAIVGASRDNEYGTDVGSAYVFVRSDSIWTLQEKLMPIGAQVGDRFGTSVSLDGDTALISASEGGFDNDNSGSVYVFVRSGSNWTQQAKLTPSDVVEERYFGLTVSVSGDTALIGSIDTSNTSNGSKFIS